ncbi:transport permease protein [Thermobispora bispora]|uniref:Transport permease protein n=1 Tax=Thermobispora bispora (strain ATCC 19993 / DSM 43833 / CBS 139.67 / JCM 10125 / KCTC 9307 / NBRC 14880 / R51) TaxID=469371 RepID=D6Y2L9_THEBD|nr:ABC transporter permease [Thermobispora bispora]MBO2473452.1 ABC transporter [Actinomycetales bacterium]MDI9581558.1 ABC transporter permease [Thermobispora sp.]ADG88868.1 ABC-2 type transporter [Thermobispora bispora DSM 43833]MBX6169093.1 ABC transporter permease [Thermobispora bispora]QSI48626.1 ABC transporter [Thermobispora bispora]
MTAEVARVGVAPRGGRHDLRAIKVVLHREMLRFVNDRPRMVSMLVQPVLWLFIMGTGFGTLVRDSIPGVDFRTFMFPGMISMTVIMTAMFSAGSIVWDREFGFLREMLVAPVSRGAIVIGKCLGGAAVACAQGVIILALAGFVGVPYSPPLMLTLLAEMFIAAFTITAFGLLFAARMRNMQSFFGLMQMAIMPMMFLSGAMFPLSNLPSWLHWLTTINPLTYTVDPMRQAVFAHLDVPPQVNAVLNPGVTWFGWQLPVGLEVAMVALIGLAMLAGAVAQFRKTE